MKFEEMIQRLASQANRPSRPPLDCAYRETNQHLHTIAEELVSVLSNRGSMELVLNHKPTIEANRPQDDPNTCEDGSAEACKLELFATLQSLAPQLWPVLDRFLQSRKDALQRRMDHLKSEGEPVDPEDEQEMQMLEVGLSHGDHPIIQKAVEQANEFIAARNEQYEHWQDCHQDVTYGEYVYQCCKAEHEAKQGAGVIARA